jgi:biopolymer transport protein ExbD
MFLLLLFLILGADMGQREIEEVVLPRAHSSVVEKPERDSRATIVNVYHSDPAGCVPFSREGLCGEGGHWRIAVRGTDYSPAGIGLLLQEDSARPSGRVILRADRAARYGRVEKVIEACALAGLDRMDISAAAAERD